jgi:hypothetical protein
MRSLLPLLLLLFIAAAGSPAVNGITCAESEREEATSLSERSIVQTIQSRKTSDSRPGPTVTSPSIVQPSESHAAPFRAASRRPLVTPARK